MDGKRAMRLALWDAGLGALAGLAGVCLWFAVAHGSMAACAAWMGGIAGAGLGLAVGQGRGQRGERPAGPWRRGVRLAGARMVANGTIESCGGTDVPFCDVYGEALREARKGRRGALLDLYLETADELEAEGRPVPTFAEVCGYLGVQAVEDAG